MKPDNNPQVLYWKERALQAYTEGHQAGYKQGQRDTTVYTVDFRPKYKNAGYYMWAVLKNGIPIQTCPTLNDAKKLAQRLSTDNL